MTLHPVTCTPVGILHSPLRTAEEAPHQGRNEGIVCTAEIFPEYAPALEGIGAYSHLILLCWFDRAERDILQLFSAHANKPHGVFARRSPARPNPIALEIGELLKLEGTRLTLRGLDVLDGTPILDIKPYSPTLDCVPEAEEVFWDKNREKDENRKPQLF